MPDSSRTLLWPTFPPPQWPTFTPPLTPPWNFTPTYTYDAENRLATAGGATYAYDGDGNRVVKMTGSTGTLYWRGADGETISETDATNTIQRRHVFFAGRRIFRADNKPTWTAHFYFSDHLGSSNVIVNAITGQIENESDFYPYGGELVITDNVPQNYKFTGKERDSESGLDNFGKRYNASSMGRFMSPDNGSDQHPENPQTWNLYSYTINNPVILIDPSGNYVCGSSMTQAQCDQFQASLDRAQAAADKAKQKYGPNSDQYKDAQRALDAYGKEGSNNGVTINIGAVGNGATATTVASNGGTKTDLNPTGQDIQVTISESVFRAGVTDTMAETAAHEGSHVADAEDWAKAGFIDAASPTKGQTEFKAYGVTSTIGEELGAGALFARRNDERHMFWNSRLPPFFNDIMRSNMVKSLYPDWPQQAFQANTHGGN